MNSAHIVIFSSAGNDGSNTDESGPEVPKTYPGVIAVGASTISDSRPSFSNFGSKTVRFFAPGGY
jgi:subtilisin family serine protease